MTKQKGASANGVELNGSPEAIGKKGTRFNRPPILDAARRKKKDKILQRRQLVELKAILAPPVPPVAPGRHM